MNNLALGLGIGLAGVILFLAIKDQLFGGAEQIYDKIYAENQKEQAREEYVPDAASGATSGALIGANNWI